MATKQELKGDWNTIAGNVKEKYGEITDDELRQVEGNAEQLVGLIQRKTGQAREQAEAYVDSLFRGEGSTSERVGQLAYEYAESTGRAVREGYEQLASRARQGYEQTTDAVAHRPMESVVAALSIGLITGLAIGLSVAAQRRPEPTWRDRWTR
ncbi:MAG: CsbD family protein [Planctomycetales bacterium]|nr:CsbD family protein [Planctomycetales bacterium]